MANKLINEARNYVDESLEGLVLAHGELELSGASNRIVRRKSGVAPGRVGIVTGGGSGHLPLFCGYVGEGLVDTCAVGNVFEGPSFRTCLEAAQLANGGAGVLQLIGNYGGERMNFALVREELEDAGVEVETVLGTDDIASAPADEISKRRGVAGLIYAYKAAGASAAAGASLSEVKQVAEKAVARTRTIGVGLGGCTLPGTSVPSFSVGEAEIDMGMGIHGEPGISRKPIQSADVIVEEMLERLLKEIPSNADGRVAILVNSLGATPLEELYIAYRAAYQHLQKKSIKVIQSLVGRYVTSMEMAGMSITLSFVDDELQRLYSAPADSPFWRV